MEGTGSIYHYGDGDIYIGEFWNNRAHGKVTKIGADETKIVGEFREGVLIKGIFSDMQKGIEYIGTFEGNKFNGQGSMTEILNDVCHKYDGQFRNN